MLVELAADNDAALTELEQSRKPVVAILNRPELIHFAVVLGAPPMVVEQLLRAVESQTAAGFFPLAGIWSPYASALTTFQRGGTPAVRPIKPKGFENFFVPYLQLMSATDAQTIAEALQAASESFASRNRDKRFNDWIGLDGDGKRPVRWDFRAYAIEEARVRR